MNFKLPRLPKAIETGVMHQRRYIGTVYTPEQMREYAQAAVLAEREACADVCEDIADTNKWSDAVGAAAAIRARKDK